VKIGVPFRIYFSTEEDEYRKPNPGMWNVLVQEYLELGVQIGMHSALWQTLPHPILLCTCPPFSFYLTTTLHVQIYLNLFLWAMLRAGWPDGNRGLQSISDAPIENLL
jgi:hypothetical protein